MIISGNLYIVMKCSFIDICVIIKFQESNFPVTAHNRKIANIQKNRIAQI